MPPRLRREDYTVGWVCALEIELAAAMAILDEEHDPAICDPGYEDENVYCMGSIAGHNVVIACLPAGQYGTNSAATVATQLQTAFKSIRFRLMVGIGGGVPSEEADIRLGDVVVSQPHGVFPGVVQYDLGKHTSTGFVRTGSLCPPPRILLSAVNRVRANKRLGRSTLATHISKLQDYPDFRRPKAGNDVLYQEEYHHVGGSTCDQCSIEKQHARTQREIGAEVLTHYGTIASGNLVIKDAIERNRIKEQLGDVLCFEMEAAGLMNSFQCLVVRGICDYADSHKNSQWQAFAAGTAAAYAKELLSVMSPAEVVKARPAEDAVNDTHKRSSRSSSPEHVPHKRSRVENPRSSEHARDDRQRTYTHMEATETSTRHSERTRVALGEEQIQRCLDSLRFEQIDARQMTIKTAHAKTCRWLLKSQQYLNWLDATKIDEHHGFLWIKGKAGTGKSTLMKFASVNARKKMKNDIVLSYFFNARGEDLEKSTLGTYRTLLLQLLESLPALQSIFNQFSASILSLNVDHQWTPEILKELLEHAIQNLGDSSVICFIDALDECDEEQVREMIQTFEHIGNLAVSEGIKFRVCFSSRHYPNITIHKGLGVVLEGSEGHSQDITDYIEAELKIGKSKIAQQIRIDLQEKASGIFMWVVLVVGILNKESDRGRVHVLRQKLREIPGDLHDLFRDILTRDSNDKDELVLCIQWVLFAKQPLSPKELFHAVYAGTDPEAIVGWDPDELTEDVAKLFVLSSSKGFAEVTRSKEPKVQFIHESIRDFLLKENGLAKIWPELDSNFDGRSHEQLKQCCLNYIRIKIADSLDLQASLLKSSSDQATSLRNLVMHRLPFLGYAAQNVLYHADTAEGKGISQANFLDMFPRTQWINVNNLIERHEIRRHTNDVSLLYLLAEFDMSNLMAAVDTLDGCTIVENERYGCPLFAAVAMGSEGALQVLMDSIGKSLAIREEIKQHKPIPFSGKRDFVFSRSKSFLVNAAEFKHDIFLALLIADGSWPFEPSLRELQRKIARYDLVISARSLFTTSRGLGVPVPNFHKTGVLDLAVRSKALRVTTLLLETGCKPSVTTLGIAITAEFLPMIELLLDSASDFSGELALSTAASAVSFTNSDILRLLVKKGPVLCTMNHQALLSEAVRIGNVEAMEVLLDMGIHLRNEAYDMAFVHAATYGHTHVMKLMLDKGADINARYRQFGSALEVALSQGHMGLAKSLLQWGARFGTDSEYGKALWSASVCGCEEVVKLLLDRGTDINTTYDNRGAAVDAALDCGHAKTGKFLLERGATFGDALWAASTRGHKKVVGLLLDAGNGISVPHETYDKALEATLLSGHLETMILLLDRAPDTQGWNPRYETALQTATLLGNSQVVQLLLDAGADVNAQCGPYGHALQAASLRGKDEIVQLLLDKGADVNAQGGIWGTALQAASYGGFLDIVSLLLDKGADVNKRGGACGSALKAALSKGHFGIFFTLESKAREVSRNAGQEDCSTGSIVTVSHTVDSNTDIGTEERTTVSRGYNSATGTMDHGHPPN